MGTSRLHSIEHTGARTYEVTFTNNDTRTTARCTVTEHAGIQGVQLEPDVFMSGVAAPPREICAAIIAFDDAWAQGDTLGRENERPRPPATAPRITLVFHSHKMLMTLDLNSVVGILLEKFGDDVAVQFRPMTDAERAAAEDSSGIVTLVKDRFLIKERRPDGSEVRHERLEERMVREGRK